MIRSSQVESQLGCWRQTEYEPSTADVLCTFVERIWLFTGTTSLARERVFPDGTLEIVLQLDAAYRRVDDGVGVVGDPFPVLSIGGLRTETTMIQGPGRPVRVLGIRLTPIGAFVLLRNALHPLTGLTIDLHAVLGPAASELGERCTAARSDRACVAASVQWLAARIEQARRPARRVLQAVRDIERDGGAAAIGALDSLGATSRARFTAAFRDQVGVTPKRFACIVRFRHALELLKGSSATVSAIALHAGYYDQAHLNAEFRLHAGMTPLMYRFARHYPNSTHLAEHFLQDDSAVAELK